MNNPPPTDGEKVRPLRFGVDDADQPLVAYTRHAKGAAIFRDLGFDCYVCHAIPRLSGAKGVFSTLEPGSEEGVSRIRDVKKHVREIDAWCAGSGIAWLASLEDANYLPSWKDETGRDWYNHPEGRHFFRMPEEILEEMQSSKSLLGCMYDEAEHQQISNAFEVGGSRTFLYDYSGDALVDAADHFVAAARGYADYYRRYGLNLYTEQILPILVHSFARAGWTPGVKVLREHWAPAYLAIAMGSAIQYGTELWVSPDLWWTYGHKEKAKRYAVLPGHSPETYHSSMLLAYHLGADCIFSENLAHDCEGKGVGCLVSLEGETGYRVTPHGETARAFIKEYVPGHPRRYSLRELKPRVAIIRQPDTCWGQATSWVPDQLFGNKQWKSSPATTAWLSIWELLSNGVISKDGLSWHALASYTGRPYQLFCPLDGVVVFDHHVGEDRLKGIEVFFLTGLGVTAKTLEAVGRCVAAGAVCVALPHLAPERVRKSVRGDRTLNDGRGIWVLTDDFLVPHVRGHIEHVLPAPDTLRYRFGNTTVSFHPANGDPNRLCVDTCG